MGLFGWGVRNLIRLFISDFLLSEMVGSQLAFLISFYKMDIKGKNQYYALPLSVTYQLFCRLSADLIDYIYLIKLKSYMSTLKIPDLNLFRGKRNNRQTQYDAVQKQGPTLLQKTANNQLLADIKAQLYLQNYQKSLNHFVSPAKYKQKAQQILKTGIRHEQLFLKAICFPTNKYRSPHCFCKQMQTKRRCVCQVQQRVLPLLRSKSNDNKPYLQSINSRREINQVQQITIASHQMQQRQYQERRKPLNIDRQVIKIEDINQKPKPQIENTERNTHNELNNKQPAYQNYKFRQDLSQREAQLRILDLRLSDQPNQQVNLRDLIEAKDSYIAKSKQILNSLERIIRSGEQRRKS